ncbi:hypothetical protein BU23DRAFT_253461 [Bimuria novae-zelandiae CBS 107.79]|uniref:Uncharacterized protein n=1 Tax=Bimuria novae-zelandiae CBS 107.79 TaxID=1447943 RepID=A0A6A5VNY5_9PLEO|nr:hypothetical protein BU23DRAFT_253461 [Bimuria novae-zelandiae CBS 107.79]
MFSTISSMSQITNSRRVVTAVSLTFVVRFTRNVYSISRSYEGPGIGDDARGGEDGTTTAAAATAGGTGVGVGAGAGVGVGAGAGGGDDDSGGPSRFGSRPGNRLLKESLRVLQDANFNVLN